MNRCSSRRAAAEPAANSGGASGESWPRALAWCVEARALARGARGDVWVALQSHEQSAVGLLGGASTPDDLPNGGGHAVVGRAVGNALPDAAAAVGIGDAVVTKRPRLPAAHAPPSGCLAESPLLDALSQTPVAAPVGRTRVLDRARGLVLTHHGAATAGLADAERAEHADDLAKRLAQATCRSVRSLGGRRRNLIGVVGNRDCAPNSSN